MNYHQTGIHSNSFEIYHSIQVKSKTKKVYVSVIQVRKGRFKNLNTYSVLINLGRKIASAFEKLIQ